MLIRSLIAAVALVACTPSNPSAAEAATQPAAPTPAPADDPLTRPIEVSNASWTAPRTPQRIFGNTYYIGSQGLSVGLIQTSEGLVVIDAGLPQSVAQIEAAIRQLGFRVEDVRLILSTEPHMDHGGGLAALSRDTGAPVLAGAAAVEALRAGHVFDDDPQEPHLAPMPPVASVRAAADGEVIRLGDVTITALATTGHTAGSMSWTWRSCEGEDCRTVVFGSSLNAVSADGYRFTDHPALVETFRRSFARFGALDCDILISAHPDNSGMEAKLDALEAGDRGPFLAPGACRAYADRAAARLTDRLAEEAR